MSLTNTLHDLFANCPPGAVACVRAFLALVTSTDRVDIRRLELPVEHAALVPQVLQVLEENGFLTPTRDANARKFARVREIKKWLSGAKEQPAERIERLKSEGAGVKVRTEGKIESVSLKVNYDEVAAELSNADTGALVSLRKVLAAFTDAKIEAGSLTLANHDLSVSLPFEGPDCLPDPARLLKAIANAPAGIVCELTPAGNLRVTSENVSVVVPCTTQRTNLARNVAGEFFAPWFPWLPVLSTLAPFCNDDGAIVFDAETATVITPLAVVQYWTGAPVAGKINMCEHLDGKGPRVLFPASLAAVVRAIGEPSAVACSEAAISFHFPNGVLVTGALHAGEPADVSGIWPNEPACYDLPATTLDACKALRSAGADLVHFEVNALASHRNIAEQGAHVACVGIHEAKLAARLDAFEKAAKVATVIAEIPNFGFYFAGDNVRGVIAGREND